MKTNIKLLSLLAATFVVSACGQPNQSKEYRRVETQPVRSALFDTDEIATPEENQNDELLAVATADEEAPAPADQSYATTNETEVQEDLIEPSTPELAQDEDVGVIDAVQNTGRRAPFVARNAVNLNDSEKTAIYRRYAHLDPQDVINQNLFKQAILFFHVNRHQIPNRKVMTIVDYSLPSSQKRLYMIDMESGRVWQTYVAHGSGSDRDHDGRAESFSNRVGSNATSLGPFLTTGTYYGKHGYSLRIEGLSRTNSNALQRSVVVHAARYVQDAAVRQGRTWGCLGLAPKYNARFINTVKGGSLIYSGVSRPELHRYR